MLRTTRCIKLTTFFALAILLAAPLYAAPATGGVADVVLGTTQVDWVPTSNSPMVSYSLVVSGPEGVVERNFEAGETPTFNLAALAGDVDGSYSWQLTATPELSADARRLMAEARAAGTTFTPKDLPSRDELIQSGHFRVVDGAVVQPSASPEPELGIATGGETLSSASEAIGLVNAADVVYNDDVIVTGSLCVGFDCVNGETFGFDTIRLKENNLRIKFEDTSTASGFPTTDWQITINDSASGGASYYRIEDITNNKVPFTIEANTPNNTLYVDQTGRVGIGTNVPVVKAHAADGNTPTLRLEQNTSSGFQAQIWDVAGNEANFFVRDVTGGSRLPFRIRPGAPTSSIDIAASGNVGIGTASPTASLHVNNPSGNADLLFDASGSANVIVDRGNQSSFSRVQFLTAGALQWSMGMVNDSSNDFHLGPNASTTHLFVDTGGDVGIGTNTPQGKLDVNGAIYQRGGVLHADYVFEPDYVLESITEHAEFMWTNKHLPAMPKATRDENGLEVVEIGAHRKGIVEELEKAHIYIEQLHTRLTEKNARLAQYEDKQQEIEAELQEVKHLIQQVQAAN